MSWSRRARRRRFWKSSWARIERERRHVMIAFLKRWIITTVAVLVAASLVPGIHYDSIEGLIIATLLLGFLNAVVRPVLIVLSLPLLLVTLGLFLLVINALLLYGV